MAQLLNLASSAVVRSGAVASTARRASGEEVQCCSASAASIGVVAAWIVGAAAVQFADELDDALGEGRLQPHQFGVTAAQPGGIYSDDVLEAAHREVEPLPVRRRPCAVRRLGPVHQRQFLQRQQYPFNCCHR